MKDFKATVRGGIFGPADQGWLISEMRREAVADERAQVVF
jgi:hypothetical protein